MVGNYGTSIDRLAASFGFMPEKKVEKVRVYVRIDAQGNEQRLFFTGVKAVKTGYVDITLKAWLSYRIVQEVEAKFFGTHYTQEGDTDAGLEAWRVDKNMDRSRGVAIPRRDPETAPAWSTLGESVRIVVDQLAQAPGIKQLAGHLTAGLQAVHDPGSVWPWMPNGYRLPLYLVVLGRTDDAKAWAAKFYEDLAIRPDDVHVKYARDHERAWAKILHEGLLISQ